MKCVQNSDKKPQKCQDFFHSAWRSVLDKRRQLNLPSFHFEKETMMKQILRFLLDAILFKIFFRIKNWYYIKRNVVKIRVENLGLGFCFRGFCGSDPNSSVDFWIVCKLGLREISIWSSKLAYCKASFNFMVINKFLKSFSGTRI